MALTQTVLGLVVLAVCHCSKHSQDIPGYHDLLKQGFSKLVTRESDQYVLDRYDVRTLIQVCVRLFTSLADAIFHKMSYNTFLTVNHNSKLCRSIPALISVVWTHRISCNYSTQGLITHTLTIPFLLLFLNWFGPNDVAAGL